MSHTEDLELSNRLEILDVIRRDLSDFEESYTSLVVDQCSSLYISLGLIGDFHQELYTSSIPLHQFASSQKRIERVQAYLSTRLVHVFQNVLIDDSTQVVNVGNEEVFFSLREKFVDQTRVHDRIEQVSVTGRVPGGLVFER